MSFINSLTVPGFYEEYMTFGLNTSDATAPVFDTSPFVSSLSPTSVSVTTTISDPSLPVTLYIVVVADGALAPSAAQIKAGTDQGDVAAPSGSGAMISSPGTPVVFAAGLSATTAYDVYYVATDDFDNDTTPAKLDITTPAVSAVTLDISADCAQNASQALSQDI